MTQEGLNEFHGLKYMSEDFIRCGCILRVFPPWHAEGTEGGEGDSNYIPITIHRTDQRSTGGNPNAYTFNKNWKDAILNGLKGKPLTKAELTGLEGKQRGWK